MEHEQPAVTAAGYDQARDGADADLDILVQAYRATVAEVGEQQATVTVGHLIAGHLAAGRSRALAGLLTVAVRRLATQGT